MQVLSFLEVFTSSSDLFIIPHFRKFVKSFFKLFQNFFLDSVAFRSARCCISRSAYKLFYYTTFQEVCQEVFQIFSNLFSLAGLMARPSALLCDSRPAWQRTYLLYHISDRLSRVFSKFLLKFFSQPVSQKRSDNSIFPKMRRFQASQALALV